MKPAFSLIESLIYLFCTVLIITFFLFFLQKFYVNCNNQIKKMHDYLEVLICADKLSRDFTDLDSNYNFWQDSSVSQLAYKTQKNKYIWCLKDNNLIKYSSNFDEQLNQFKKPGYSLLLQKVENFKFNIIKDKKGKILGLNYNICRKTNKNSFSLDNFIALRLGQEI